MKTSQAYTIKVCIKASWVALFFILLLLVNLVYIETSFAQTNQTAPPANCNPLPEDSSALSECMAYYGTDGQATTSQSQPGTQASQSQPYNYSSGGTAPANCNPLPEDSNALSECMAYYGTDGQATINGFGGAPVSTNTTDTGTAEPRPPAPVNTVAIQDPDNEFAFSSTDSFGHILSQIYIYALGVSALLAMIMIVFGGYTIMSARGNASQAAKGKDYVLSALVGMVLLMAAFLILNTINPDLTQFKF